MFSDVNTSSTVIGPSARFGKPLRHLGRGVTVQLR